MGRFSRFQELRQVVDDYLTGRRKLRDLESWIVANLQRVLDSQNDQAIEMVYQIDADLIELGEGLNDQLSFDERLESYLRATQSLTGG